MLNGIVQDSQIEEKIIELDFDDDKINKWAATLAPKDAKKSKGENQWNTTEIKEDKNIERAKRVFKEEINIQKYKNRVEYKKVN